MTKDNSGKGKTIIVGIAVAIAGAAITFGVMKYVYGNTSFDKLVMEKAVSFDKLLMEKAVEINKYCPRMIDNGTQFDFVNALPGNKFQYNYTLTGAEAGAVDTNAVKDYVRPNILNFVKTNHEMAFAKKNNTTLFYNYRDMHGNFLFQLTLLPEQYNRK